MMSDIPEARRQLLLVAKMADAQTAGRIRHIVSKYMTRDKTIRRAPQKSASVTSSVVTRIKQMAYHNPTMHQTEIAALFNVNPGRVSEILHGKRK